MLKKQICSVEQAKELAKFGLTQSSLFYYVNNWRNTDGSEINDGEHIVIGGQLHLTRIEGRRRGAEVEFVSAYTETELCAFYQLCHVKGIYANGVIEKAKFLIETLSRSLFAVEECNNNFAEYFELSEVNDNNF